MPNKYNAGESNIGAKEAGACTAGNNIRAGAIISLAICPISKRGIIAKICCNTVLKVSEIAIEGLYFTDIGIFDRFGVGIGSQSPCLCAIHRAGTWNK